MKKKKILQFMKVFCLILLSFILALDVIIYGLRDITKEFMSEDKIKEEIAKINPMDFLTDQNGEALEEVEKLKNNLVASGFPVETVDSVLNSEPVQEFTSQIITESIDYVLYDKEPTIVSSINSENIMSFAEKNMNTVVSELQNNNVPKSELLTEQRQEQILTKLEEKTPMIQENVEKVVNKVQEKIENSSQFNQIKDYQTKLEKALKIIRFIYSETLHTILIAVFILCIFFILLLCHSFYKYLKYFGISSFFSSIGFFIITYVITKLSPYINKLPTAFQTLCTSILEDMKSSFTQYATTCIMFAISFLLLNVFIWYLKEHRENKKIKSI
jgi:hypothetical protein